MSRSWSAVRRPAPGSSRSMTYRCMGWLSLYMRNRMSVYGSWSAVHPRIPGCEEPARIGAMRPHVQHPQAEDVVLEELLAEQHGRSGRPGHRRVRHHELHADEAHLAVGARLVDQHFR